MIKCSNCGASNPPGAQWCGQCLQRAATEEPVAATVATSPGESPLASRGNAPRDTASSVGTKSGAFTVTEDGVRWECRKCGTDNPIELDACAVCGASFSDAIRPQDEPGRPRRDPNAVALVSLFWSGAGHAYLGLWGQAVARGVIGLWLAAVVVFVGVQRGPATALPLLFGVIAFALWLIAAHDAYREATGASSAVILKPRYFLYVVLGLLLLLLALLVLQGLGGTAASGAGKFGG